MKHTVLFSILILFFSSFGWAEGGAEEIPDPTIKAHQINPFFSFSKEYLEASYLELGRNVEQNRERYGNDYAERGLRPHSSRLQYRARGASYQGELVNQFFADKVPEEFKDKLRSVHSKAHKAATRLISTPKVVEEQCNLQLIPSLSELGRVELTKTNREGLVQGRNALRVLKADLISAKQAISDVERAIAQRNQNNITDTDLDALETHFQETWPKRNDPKFISFSPDGYHNFGFIRRRYEQAEEEGHTGSALMRTYNKCIGLALPKVSSLVAKVESAIANNATANLPDTNPRPGQLRDLRNAMAPHREFMPTWGSGTNVDTQELGHPRGELKAPEFTPAGVSGNEENSGR